MLGLEICLILCLAVAFCCVHSLDIPDLDVQTPDVLTNENCTGGFCVSMAKQPFQHNTIVAIFRYF